MCVPWLVRTAEKGHLLWEEGRARLPRCRTTWSIPWSAAQTVWFYQHRFSTLQRALTTSWLQRGSPASGVIACTEHQNLQKWCQQLGKLPEVAVEQSFKECNIAKVLRMPNMILCGKTETSLLSSQKWIKWVKPVCKDLKRLGPWDLTVGHRR